MQNHSKFMERAIELARIGIHENHGGPFGCVIVKHGRIIGEGYNRVTIDRDPTAHAEIVAIRNACSKINDHQLTGCELYTTCEPCPMCLGAIYWARPKMIYYGSTRKDAADAGFDDDFIYHQLHVEPAERKIKMIPLERPEALLLFDDWRKKEDKKEY